MRLGRDPNEVAELMLHPDRIGALYADAYRRKTIDHLMSVVTITNEPPPEPEPEVEDEGDIQVVSPNSVDSPDSPDSEDSEDSADSPDSLDSPDEGDEEE